MMKMPKFNEKELALPKNNGFILFLFLFLILNLCLLAACVGPKRNTYRHEFSFEVNKSADILDYRYGESHIFGTEPSKLDKDIIAKIGRDSYAGWSVTGYYMPKPNSLYVKWRDTKSQEIFEEVVDLRGKLPENMTNWTVYFEAHAKNLYVYLFPPRKFTTNAGDSYDVNGYREIVGRKETQDIPYNQQHMIFKTNN